MACLANPIAQEVSAVQQDISSAYKKVKRGVVALQVAGPSLNEQFVADLRRDLSALVEASKTLIVGLNSGALDFAPHAQLLHYRDSLASIVVRFGIISSGCKLIGLDKYWNFEKVVVEIESLRDRFESFVESLSLSLQPEFQNAIEVATALLKESASERIA